MINKIARLAHKWTVKLLAWIATILFTATLMAVTGIAELVLAMSPAMIVITIIVLASAWRSG